MKTKNSYNTRQGTPVQSKTIINGIHNSIYKDRLIFFFYFLFQFSTDLYGIDFFDNQF